MRVCKLCGKEHHAKDLCEHHYGVSLRSSPEGKKKYNDYMRKYMKEYYHIPEIKARHLKQQKEYCNRPEIKEKKRKYMKEYVLRPGVKEGQKEAKERYATKKKLERLL